MNDLLALDPNYPRYSEAICAKRLQYFQSKILPQLQIYPIIENEEKCEYSVLTEDLGRIDIYPRSNLVHICAKGTKLGNALNWIKDNLLPKEAL